MCFRTDVQPGFTFVRKLAVTTAGSAPGPRERPDRQRTVRGDLLNPGGGLWPAARRLTCWGWRQRGRDVRIPCGHTSLWPASRRGTTPTSWAGPRLEILRGWDT